MNKTQQVIETLKQSYLFEDSPRATLGTYHAARAALNGNRCIGTQRRLNLIRKALKPFAVTITASPEDINGPIRLHNPRTKAEYIFATFAIVLALTGLSVRAGADTTCHQVGRTTFCDDDRGRTVTCTKVGNTTFCS
jgi:hypothetical protein